MHVQFYPNIFNMDVAGYIPKGTNRRTSFEYQLGAMVLQTTPSTPLPIASQACSFQ